MCWKPAGGKQQTCRNLYAIYMAIPKFLHYSWNHARKLEKPCSCMLHHADAFPTIRDSVEKHFSV
jgi:hypothetical protein